MDVLLRDFSVQHLSFLVGDAEVFALYLSKLSPCKLATPSTKIDILRALQYHYPSYRDLINFAQDYLFRRLEKKQHNNVIVVDFFKDEAIKSNDSLRSALPAEYERILTLYIIVRILLIVGSFQLRKCERLGDSQVIIPYIAMPTFDHIEIALPRRAPSAKAQFTNPGNAEGARLYRLHQAHIFQQFIGENWIYMSPTANEFFLHFRGFIHMYESKFPKHIHKIGGAISESKMRLPRIAFRIHSDLEHSFQVSSSSIGLGHHSPIYMQLGSSLLLLEAKTPIHLNTTNIFVYFTFYYELAQEECEQLPYFMDDLYLLEFEEHLTRASDVLADLPPNLDTEQTRETLVQLFYNWAILGGLEICTLAEFPHWKENELAGKIHSLYNSEFKEGQVSNVSKPIMMGKLLWLHMSNKGRLQGRPPGTFRFIVVIKRTQRRKGMLYIFTLFLDQQLKLLIPYMHYYTEKGEGMEFGKYNRTAGRYFWYAFLLEYSNYAHLQQTTFAGKQADEQRRLNKMLHRFIPQGIWDSNKIILHSIFPELLFTSKAERLSHVKHFLFPWTCMGECSALVPFPLHYLHIKTKSTLEQVRQEYSDSIRIHTGNTLEELMEIIKQRLILTLSILGAVPKADYERYKLDDVPTESPVDSNAVMFALTVAPENIILVEDALKQIEDLLYDNSELSLLQQLSRQSADEDWSWWMSKKPFLNIQKICRYCINQGLCLNAMPMAYKEWVLDKNMLII